MKKEKKRATVVRYTDSIWFVCVQQLNTHGILFLSYFFFLLLSLCSFVYTLKMKQEKYKKRSIYLFSRFYFIQRDYSEQEIWTVSVLDSTWKRIRESIVIFDNATKRAKATAKNNVSNIKKIQIKATMNLVYFFFAYLFIFFCFFVSFVFIKMRKM